MKTPLYILLTALSINCASQNDLTSNLVICMPFDGNATDYSGNNNNGTIIGATLTTDRFGNLNSAYHFNGTSSNYITVPHSTSLGNIEINDEITISIWCNINNWYQNYNIFPLAAKHNVTTDYGWDFSVANPNLASGKDITFISNYPKYYTVGSSVTFHNWIFYAVTYSKSTQTVKLYKNGNLLSTTTNSMVAGLENTGTGSFYIGYSPAGPNEYSNGDIDELKVYNRALTDAEILALYNGTPCIPQVGIKEYSSQESLFSIYPNPTTTTLNINFNTQFINDISKTISIKVFSIDGKLVKIEEVNKSELNQHIINISSLSKGLYYLTITSGNYSQNLKFIKE